MLRSVRYAARTASSTARKVTTPVSTSVPSGGSLREWVCTYAPPKRPMVVVEG